MPSIRVLLGTQELALEGSEEFLERFADPIAAMLERLEREVRGSGALPPSAAVSDPGSVDDSADFGETLLLLPRSATGTDQILLAGQFAQANSEDDTFETREASQLLIEQGIQLSNPSQAIKNNLKAKRLFKRGGKFRVSREGNDHLRSLISRSE